MNLIERIHNKYVHARRIEVLARHLCDLLPRNAAVLDVGCGDGWLASKIMGTRVDVRIVGIDVLIRGRTHIQVEPFDGKNLPYKDRSIDTVMFVDVLHHTLDPMILLREAVRVTRGQILIKDHLRDRIFAGPTLRFMDHIGNARHGVSIPYNYWRETQWRTAFRELRLEVASWNTDLGLYPPGLDLVFGGSLHMISSLEVQPTPES
jgi:SAM-dependent methyltransferase